MPFLGWHPQPAGLIEDIFFQNFIGLGEKHPHRALSDTSESLLLFFYQFSAGELGTISAPQFILLFSLYLFSNLRQCWHSWLEFVILGKSSSRFQDFFFFFLTGFLPQLEKSIINSFHSHWILPSEMLMEEKKMINSEFLLLQSSPAHFAWQKGNIFK